MFSVIGDIATGFFSGVTDTLGMSASKKRNPTKAQYKKRVGIDIADNENFLKIGTNAASMSNIAPEMPDTVKEITQQSTEGAVPTRLSVGAPDDRTTAYKGFMDMSQGELDRMKMMFSKRMTQVKTKKAMPGRSQLVS
jgi:hypothetical protein